MRVLCAIFLTLMISCKYQVKEHVQNGENNLEFRLIDSLGSISMDYPERTDTFFTWIVKSDCGKPCEYGAYRFQSRQKKIYKESGFVWVGEPEDSVEQLTVYHRRVDVLGKDSASLVTIDKERLLFNLLSDPYTYSVISDTVYNIANRPFLIFKLADVRQSGVRDVRLIAFTQVNGWEVEFHYKLLTKKYDSVVSGFYDRSLRNMATIRFKPGG